MARTDGRDLAGARAQFERPLELAHELESVMFVPVLHWLPAPVPESARATE